MSVNHFCSQCGKKLEDNQTACTTCATSMTAATSPKSGLTTFLLCLFLGSLGIHRFYVGKVGTGILMLITSGGFGIWYLYDLITIVCNNFKDKEGRYVEITRNPSTAKTVALVVGSIVAAFVLMFASIMLILMLFLGGLADVAQSELSALRAGDFEKAYSYTSKEFQQDVSLDNFKEFVRENPILKNNISASFPQRKIENNYALISGTLKIQDNQYVPIEIQFIKEDNTWKIIYIDLKPAPSDNNSKAADQTTETDDTTAESNQ